MKATVFTHSLLRHKLMASTKDESKYNVDIINPLELSNILCDCREFYCFSTLFLFTVANLDTVSILPLHSDSNQHFVNIIITVNNNKKQHKTHKKLY